MKPKINQGNGYLTPQASRRKSLGALGASKAKSSSKLQNGSPTGSLLNLDEGLVRKLLDDPIKRQLIVDLIVAHKDQIDEYKKAHAIEGLRKVQAKPTCESPTALFRRRLMEQKERPISRNESDSASSSSSRPNSAMSGASVVPSPVPLCKVLEGVIAYVEVQTNGNDRSQGVKIRIKEMGAIVRDQFTKDITHVIFKDGFFTTYKKAQLIKAHIVSVLWIEACRNEGIRVPEKKYPAIGPDIHDFNTSALCSQMQKEYEEVIRDELNKSFSTGAPLPSKQDLINRRRTLMTPTVTKTFSQELPSSQDFEVAEIFRKSRRTLGPLYTHNQRSSQGSSDADSDLGAVVNGPVTKRKDVSHSRRFDTSDDVIDSSCMDLTELHGTVIDSNTNLAKENVQPPVVDTIKSPASSYKTAVDSPSVKNTSSIKILSKNVCSPRIEIPNEVSSAMSALQISDKSKTTSTTMSSLRVSSDSKVAEVQPRHGEYVTMRKKPAQIKGAPECSPPKKNKMGTEDSDRTVSGLVKSSEENVETEIGGKLQSSKQLDKFKDRRKSKKPDKATEPAGEVAKPKNTTRKSVLKAVDKQIEPAVNDKNTYSNQPQFDKPSHIRKSLFPTDVEHLSSNKAKANTLPREKPKISRKSVKPKKPSINLENDVEPNGVRRSLFTTTSITSPGEKQAKDQLNSGKKKFRKLYNPDDVLLCDEDVCDERERERLREEAKKKKTDGVFIRPMCISLKPNVFVSEKAKEYMDQQNTDIDDVLNKHTDSDSDHKSAKKRTKKKQVTQKRQVVYDDRFSLTKGIFAKKDDADDENKEKPTPSRKSVRLSLKPRKTFNSDHSISTDTESEKTPAKKPETPHPKSTPARRGTQITPKTQPKIDIKTPVNRRSTLEFQPKDQMNTARRLKIDKLQMPTIVCTKLHKDDVVVFNQIVKKLGKFSIEDEVSSRTTHLVAGEPKRTINMLRAMARGCWILKYEWLLKSLEAEKWLPEEDFEEIDFSPAVRQSRLQRQAFGPSYSMDVFQDCGVIYVARGSTPRCSDLRELVKLCGAKVTTITRNADIIVGGYQNRDDVICVTEIWVLDSIKFNKKMNCNKYKITSDNNVML
ncbi:unnamed protein product [Acanthoscelides obtectus]|uniref:BRCT domain-containing protein n=1 Tax=Acanthoscelides obtectus TaxID=200917 RepID=A0A9P0PHM4_ACAOB|nr:unnamed protein product [Acanthoscelides obtectus]CAK1646031.1 Microcephalin [Acanthoscelides obtectus]